MADILRTLASVNLAAGIAVLAVLAARGPARMFFGARAAYALWLIVPFAALAILIPPRVVTVLVERPQAPGTQFFALSVESGSVQAAEAAAGSAISAGQVLILLWAAGVFLSLALLTWSQQQFIRSLGRLRGEGRLRRAEAPGVGPAVVGALFPKIVLPSDFETRYGPAERAAILAHEETHLTAGHAATNAVVALIQCLCWFNPLIHIAAFFVRVDQELACDATVLARRPEQRKLYAEALLKTQMGGKALPFGCYWPADGEHPLKARIAMLKRPQPSDTRRWIGGGVALLFSLSAGVAAWSSQPPVKAYVLVSGNQSGGVAAPAAEPAGPRMAALPGPSAFGTENLIPADWMGNLASFFEPEAARPLEALAQVAAIDTAVAPAPAEVAAPAAEPAVCRDECEVALAEEMPDGPMGLSSIALMTGEEVSSQSLAARGARAEPARTILRAHNAIPAGQAVEISGTLRFGGGRGAAPLKMVFTPSAMNAMKSPNLGKLGVRSIGFGPQIIDSGAKVRVSSYVRTSDNLYSPHSEDFWPGETRTIQLGDGHTLTLRVTIRMQNAEERMADLAASSGTLAAAAGPPMTAATRNARVSIPGLLAVDSPPQPSRTRLASITGKVDLSCTVAARRLEDCYPVGESSNAGVTDAAMTAAFYLELPPESGRPNGSTLKVPFYF